MSELLVKEKEVVIPGEELASGMDYLPSNGTYRDGDKVVAAKLGLVNIEGKVIKIIPLSGQYIPKKYDTIIGNVVDVLMSGWRIDTFSPYTAMLPVRDATSAFINKGADLTQYFDLGDYIITKIINVTSQKLVDVTMKGPGLRRLQGGRIIRVNSNKVPRIIGKQGSMIGLVKQATNCRIIVGQNGVIWIDGEPKDEVFAVSVIKKIEDEAHTSGLTDKIKDHLEKITGKKLTINVDEKGEQNEL